MERLLRDGENAKVLELLLKLDDDDKTAPFFLITELKLRREKRLIESSGSWLKLVNDGFVYYRKSNFNEAVFQEFLKIIEQAPLVEGIEKLIQKKTNGYTDQKIFELITMFKDRALAEANVTAAAGIYTTAFPLGLIDLESSREIVRLWRMNAKPEMALSQLLRVTKGKVFDDDDLLAFVDLRVGLLKELGQINDAYLLFKSYVEVHPEVLVKDDVFGKLKSLAIESDHVDNVVSFYKLRLDHISDRKETLLDYIEELIKLQKLQDVKGIISEEPSIFEGVPDLERSYAQLLEWSSEPESAFNYYKKLAMASDEKSLARMKDLYTGLMRDREYAEALAVFVKEGNDPVLGYELAKLYVRLGRYDEAIDLIKESVSQIDKDLHVYYLDLADIYRTTYRFDEAKGALALADNYKPGDANIKRQIAEIQVFVGDYDNALSEYEVLFNQYQNDGDLDAVISLAFSSRNMELYHKFLEMKVRKKINVKVQNYLDLIFYYAENKQLEKSYEFLDLAFQHYPNEKEIVKLVFINYQDRKAYDDAFAMLKKYPDLLDDSLIYTSFIYLTINSRSNALLEHDLPLRSKNQSGFIKNGMIQKAIADYYISQQRIDEAIVIYEHLLKNSPKDIDLILGYVMALSSKGRKDEVLVLLEPILESDQKEKAYELAALVYTELGDFEKAEKYQIAYIKSGKRNNYYGLGFLGDIRLSRGDDTGSERAYRSSLFAMIRSFDNSEEEKK